MTLFSHCLLFLSCGNSESKTDVKEIQISLKDLKCDTIKVAELVKNLEIIPLEDKPSYMIGWPSRFIVTKNGFFIYDRPSGDIFNVMYFNKKGKALNKIGAIGHGRGEYETLWDTATDRNGDTIIVTSWDKHYLYDKKGKYLTSKEFGIECGLINSIAKTSSGYICTTEYTGAKYQLHVYDNDLNLIDELLPTNDKVSGVPNNELNHIQVKGNKIYYLDYHNSTFHCLDLLKKKDKVAYHFIDKDMLSLDNLEKMQNQDMGMIKFTCINGYYMENENIICRLENTSKLSITNIKINTKTNEVRKLVYDGWIPLIFDYDYYEGYHYLIMNQTEFLRYVEEHGPDYIIESDDYEFVKKLKEVYKTSGLNINETLMT